MKLTARSRLETYASLSRTQSDEETYDLERTVVGSVVAGVTAGRCGQCCACDRTVVPVDVGDGETDDVAMTLLERVEEAEAERDRLRAENVRLLANLTMLRNFCSRRALARYDATVRRIETGSDRRTTS